MKYGPDWRPPWRTPEKAQCKGTLCGGQLVVASTLDGEGLCASCSDTPARQDERVLRLEL